MIGQTGRPAADWPSYLKGAVHAPTPHGLDRRGTRRPLAWAGDMDSFNQLILRWERPIYALVYRVIGREEDARDVCQETFLRAFRSLRASRARRSSRPGCTGLR